MPANIRIIHANEFIKSTPEGRLNLEVSKKLLIEIAVASASLAEYDILLDTRMMQSVLTASDLWALSSELSNNFQTSFSRTLKTAILCPPDRFDHAEFLAHCAQNKGFQVMAFTSFEDAYEWLVANRT